MFIFIVFRFAHCYVDHVVRIIAEYHVCNSWAQIVMKNFILFFFKVNFLLDVQWQIDAHCHSHQISWFLFCGIVDSMKNISLYNILSITWDNRLVTCSTYMDNWNGR